MKVDRHSSTIKFMSKIDCTSMVRVLVNKAKPMEKMKKEKSVNMTSDDEEETQNIHKLTYQKNFRYVRLLEKHKLLTSWIGNDEGWGEGSTVTSTCYSCRGQNLVSTLYIIWLTASNNSISREDLAFTSTSTHLVHIHENKNIFFFLKKE